VSHTVPPGAPDPEEDEALARLRDADPARAVEPDLAGLRAHVDARLAQPDAAPSVLPAAPPPPANGADELAARRARRHRWPLVAAAAAGVVVVGSAGYGAGRLGNPGPGDEVITLAQAPSQGPAAAEGGGVGAAEPGAQAGAAGDARVAIYPPYGTWRTVFSASGLSDAAGSAPAWGFDAAAVFSAESAQRAASVFGVEGEATSQYGTWTVGPTDGTGPTVSLQPDGWASLSYYDPTRDPYACARAGDATAPDAAGGAPCSGEDPGPAPTGEQAAAELRRLLAELGIDATIEVESTVYDVTEGGTARQTSVTGYQLLEGQRTGVTWSATLLGDGAQAFYGPLAPLTDLGAYDVVSENTAVQRLNDPRFGGTGGVIPFAESARVASDDPASAAVGDVPVDGPSDTPTVPPALEPGADIPWPVTEVTITGARLGSAVQWLTDGQVVIVPAYELTDDDGGSWSVIAVTDDRLDFTAD
jgi:hypothetical protein